MLTILSNCWAYTVTGQTIPLSGCCVACSDPTAAGFQEEEVLWVLEAPCGGHGNPGWRRGNRGVAAVDLSI